jgi:hypothetical protein
MNIKKLVPAFIISLAVIAALLAITNRPTQAESYDSDISRKLDAIAADQKTILSELAAIKEEVVLIKVRVTQNQ